MHKLLNSVRRAFRIMELNASLNSYGTPFVNSSTPIHDQLEREWVARYGNKVMS
jgi:hypothetical protein